MRPNRTVRHVHIPKTAGDSLKLELLRFHVPTASREACWRSHMAQRGADDVTAVFFRSPRHHVRSMFVQCRNHRKGAALHHLGEGPRFDALPNDDAGLEQWLRSFLAGGWRDGFLADADARKSDRARVDGCLHPENLQTRTMACADDAATGSCHFVGADAPDLDTAAENLRAADVVGVLEFYHESTCLLFAAYADSGRVPAFCACDAEHKATHRVHSYDHVQIRHNSAQAGANLSSDLPPRVAALADDLTALDRGLYVLALARFLADVAALEGASGTRVLCRPAVDRAAAQLAYLPEAAALLLPRR